jgi:hypothetical protein
MKDIPEENLAVRNVILGMAFILAFLWVINPTSRSAVGINLVFLAISFIVYRAKEYQDDVIGITKGNILASAGYGVLFTGLFFLITLVVPGMSIGYPALPASISDSLKFFLVVFVAPIAESIFFQGALYAYISNFDNTPSKSKKWRAIIIQALGFSGFHLASYVSGFYLYPGFTEGMSAVMANISGFIVAFLFALIAGWWVTRDGVKNLVFCVVFHLGLNVIAYSLSVAVILLVAPFISSNPIFALGFLPIVFFKIRPSSIYPSLFNKIKIYGNKNGK